jgi:hypothetical protein
VEHQLTVGRLETEHRIELELDPDHLLDSITSPDHFAGVFGPENQFRIEELRSHGWHILGVEWSEPSEVGGISRVVLSLTRVDFHYPAGDANPSRSS